MKLHTRWRNLITLVLAGALLSGALAAHAAAPAGVTIWGYQEGLALAEIDLDYLDQVRRDLPCLAHRRADLY